MCPSSPVYASIRYIAVSLPYASQLIDHVEYMKPQDVKPPEGDTERRRPRAPRAPSMRFLAGAEMRECHGTRPAATPALPAATATRGTGPDWQPRRSPARRLKTEPTESRRPGSIALSCRAISSPSAPPFSAGFFAVSGCLAPQPSLSERIDEREAKPRRKYAKPNYSGPKQIFHLRPPVVGAGVATLTWIRSERSHETGMAPVRLRPNPKPLGLPTPSCPTGSQADPPRRHLPPVVTAKLTRR